MSDEYLQDREDPKVFAAKLAAATAHITPADTPEEFIRQFNYRPPPSDAERLEAARTAYAEHDKRWAELEYTSDRPAQQPSDFNERRRLFEQQQTLRDRRVEEEKALFKAHGERPAPQSVAEMVEMDRARNWASPEGIAELTKEQERSIAKMLDDGGFPDMDAAREWYRTPASERRPAPVPSLIETEQGVPAYVLPGGEIVEAYAVAFGKAAKNPRFAEIQARVEKIQGARR